MGTLRLLLALSVVLFHSEPFWLGDNRLVGGVLAVESFFLISGFYMALVLSARYRERLGDFFWNRLVRLFPLYWAVWLLSFAAGEIVPSVDRFSALAAVDPGAPTVALVLLANWLMVGSDWLLLLSTGPEGLYFTPSFLDEPVWLFKFHYVPQAWSLPIELAFYALAPLLVHSPRRLLIVAGAAALAKYLTLRQIGPVDPWTYRFMPFELWLFCIGALAFHACERLKGRVEWLGWPVLLGMIAFTVGYEWGNPSPTWAVDAPRYFAYLAAMSLAMPVLFLAFGSARWDRMLGELSYPVYLVHLLVIGVVGTFGWRLAGDASVLIVLGSLAAAALLALGIGLPLEARLRRARPDRSSAVNVSAVPPRSDRPHG